MLPLRRKSVINPRIASNSSGRCGSARSNVAATLAKCAVRKMSGDATRVHGVPRRHIRHELVLRLSGRHQAKKKGRARRRGQVIREETPKRAGAFCTFAAVHASHDFSPERNSLSREGRMQLAAPTSAAAKSQRIHPTSAFQGTICPLKALAVAITATTCLRSRIRHNPAQFSGLNGRKIGSLTAQDIAASQTHVEKHAPHKRLFRAVSAWFPEPSADLCCPSKGSGTQMPSSHLAVLDTQSIDRLACFWRGLALELGLCMGEPESALNWSGGLDFRSGPTHGELR